MATMSDTNRARPTLVVFDTDRFDSPREAILIAARATGCTCNSAINFARDSRATVAHDDWCELLRRAKPTDGRRGPFLAAHRGDQDRSRRSRDVRERGLGAFGVTSPEMEWLAHRTAELICERLGLISAPTASLVDVATVAATLSVSQKFVRKHAIELGGRQLIPGGPWRFDLANALRAAPTPAASPRPEPGSKMGRPRRAPSRPDTAPLLPVRGLP
jgi:hypothetical protein